MRRIVYCLAVIITALWGVSPYAVAEDDASLSAKEYQIKAAYLYNFVKFVEWPGARSLSVTHTANICIMGDDPFGSAMDIFRQASSAQLALNVRRNVTFRDIPDCNILFVSNSEADAVSAIIAHTKGYPVLTVSEIPGFADKGGIIEMVRVEKNIGLFSKDKINLRINIKAADSEGLRIDAQLLEIAAEVMK
jgi:hypothetical protein